MLKQSTSGKQKLLFQSKDPSFPLPSSSEPFNDPRQVGATIEVVTAGVVATPFDVPENGAQTGWTLTTGSICKYKRAKEFVATTTIKSIVIKNARGITIAGDATGIPLDGARDAVGIRITIGEVRSCARFTGASVTKNVVGTFKGKNATTDGFADCSLTSLTGAAPVCGDGEVNQPQESCDGTCSTAIGEFTCRQPGPPNECQCCQDGYGPSIVPCCNPSSVVIPSGGIGSRICIPAGCAPPDECRSGDQCQPDDSCCSTVGGNRCATSVPGFTAVFPLVPCCPGLACARPNFSGGSGGAVCCAAGGTNCTGDSECCTGHCQIDGTCEGCRAGGAGCAAGVECCSGSCSAGACNACGPPFTFCTSGATCCSGSCSNFFCN
jgi:hypothetical protein